MHKSALILSLAIVLSGAGVAVRYLVMHGELSAVALAPPVATSGFNGDQAMEYLEAICKLGPRISGSQAMKRQQELLKKHFEELGVKVELQAFTGVQPSLRGRGIPCANLIVRWHPESKRRILLGAHYDTRPMADEEPLARNRKEFPGANDGASGVAFLMELGRLMPELKLSVGVDFVLFDAEEYIYDRSDRYFLGSEYFVKEYTQSRGDFRYDAVVVVDMIADKNLTIHPDERSSVRSGPLVKEVFGIARELRVSQFKQNVKHDILDDHISFHAAGIPAIVLIDFDYPYWHRLSDTPDKCSGASMEAVATVVVEWMKRRR